MPTIYVMSLPPQHRVRSSAIYDVVAYEESHQFGNNLLAQAKRSTHVNRKPPVCTKLYTSALTSIAAHIWAALDIWVLRVDKGGGNGRSPRKPADQRHRLERFPGIEPGSPWWEANALAIARYRHEVWHCSSESIVYIQNSISPLDCQKIKEYVTLSEDFEASCVTRGVGGGEEQFRVRFAASHNFRASKYTNRIRLERASQKQFSDSHKTPYDGVKRRQERKINTKASERVNVDSELRLFFLSGGREGHAMLDSHPINCPLDSDLEFSSKEGNMCRCSVLSKNTQGSLNGISAPSTPGFMQFGYAGDFPDPPAFLSGGKGVSALTDGPVDGLLQVFLARLMVEAFQATSNMTPEDIQLIKCMSAICNQYLPPNLPTLLKSNPHNQILAYAIAHMMHSSLHWQVVLSAIKADNHVLLLHNGQDLPALMAGISWNTTGLFLVVALSCNLAGVRAAASVLWSYKIVKVLVLAVCTQSVDVYTLIPYHSLSNCGSHPQVVLLDKWLFSEGQFFHGNDLFLSQVPKNFHGCPFQISTFTNGPYVLGLHYFTDDFNQTKLSFKDGIEIQILNSISDQLNFSVIFNPIPPNNIRWGQQLRNGTWTGILGNVINGKADIAFAGMMLNTERLLFLKNTYPFFKDTISWAVPIAKPLPHWKSLIKIFPASIWWLVSLTYFVNSVFVYYLCKLKIGGIPSPRIFGSLSECLLYLYSMFLANAIPVMPRHVSPRLLFGIFLLYSLVINTAYRTFLIVDITHPMHEHQISSPEDILSSGIEFGFHPNIDRFFVDNSGTSKQIMDGHIVCMDIEKCIERVAMNGDFAISHQINNIEYVITKNFLDAYNKPMAKMLPESAMHFFITMYMQKNSVILGPFNAILIRLVEAGLIEKWRLDVLRNAYKLKEVSSDKAPIVLSLSHLEGRPWKSQYLHDVTDGAIHGMAPKLWPRPSALGSRFLLVMCPTTVTLAFCLGNTPVTLHGDEAKVIHITFKEISTEQKCDRYCSPHHHKQLGLHSNISKKRGLSPILIHFSPLRHVPIAHYHETLLDCILTCDARNRLCTIITSEASSARTLVKALRFFPKSRLNAHNRVLMLKTVHDKRGTALGVISSVLRPLGGPSPLARTEQKGE
ncbi:hypothetical protein PR048_027937 [Dryococelus australis]|uniref:Ionotropic glutamate receptor L-glutamate and glycine-binding domain-containing protein n=1 Tax=Dryococelus australis TaxID=614101 RepID=A0ABQ9GHW7_9NEOP|nr:hypothetical protein PR048_027937 [Dryococelus australis]